jgi:hypothetical protein
MRSSTKRKENTVLLWKPEKSARKEYSFVMKTIEFKLEEKKDILCTVCRETSSESKVCGTSVLEFLNNLWGL